MNSIFFAISLVFIIYDGVNILKKKRTSYMFYRPFMLNILANLIFVNVSVVNKSIVLLYLVVVLWMINNRFAFIGKGGVNKHE